MYDDNYDFYVEIDEDITLKTGIDENLIVDIIQQTIRIKYSEKMIVDITFVDK
ncbi:MAG: hypothetical protein M0Q02_05875 [Candidatus Muirbacterium halophilum]|nr:hypothetical protein [Candidatus Muirbacterium halophilum]